MIDYTKFYGFSENPFDISPDPKFFFPAESHGEALASLRYGINDKKGFILILGEAGIGKTTLLHHLMNTLDSSVKPIYFPQSQSHFEQMLSEMLVQLELSPGLKTKGSMIHELYNALIGCLKRDETVAVIIDEAQNIGLDVIEEVRLLANLETSTSKLLQIVLVGQPELREKLRSEVIRQIKQRIVIVSQIKPLSEKEALLYIDHRLQIAGSGAMKVFTDEALSLICQSAKGIPLALNILCSNALSVGCALAEKKISLKTVKKVRREKGILTPEKADILASRIKRRLTRKISYSISALVILAIAFFFGRNYVQPLMNYHKTDRLASLPATAEKATAPKIKHQAVAKHTADSPAPKVPAVALEVPPIPAAARPAAKVPAVAMEVPPIPALKPAAEGLRKSEIRLKEIADVKDGVNLYALAYRYYKFADETLIDHILKLNPEIQNPHLILVNSKIRIPEINEALLIVQYGGAYKIHMRTFSNPQSAAQFRRYSELWGKETEVVTWKISAGEKWYRVMAGPFAGRDEAAKTLEQMKQKGFSIIPSRTGK